jgi:hypothetical protein
MELSEFRAAETSGRAFSTVAWSMLGLTLLAAGLFLGPRTIERSPWLAIACALSLAGPFAALFLAGYVGPLEKRRMLYLLLPAGSIGGQSMFLAFFANAIGSDRFGMRRVVFNVNWIVLVAATIGAWILLAAFVRWLRDRWDPYPEMVCPLVGFWMGLNLLALELGSAYLARGRLLDSIPNALPHLIMGSVGFFLFVRLARRAHSAGTGSCPS